VCPVVSEHCGGGAGDADVAVLSSRNVALGSGRDSCLVTMESDREVSGVDAAAGAPSLDVAGWRPTGMLGEAGVVLCTAIARSSRGDMDASRVGVREGGTVVAVARGVALPDGVAVSVVDFAGELSCAEGP
jgi:hypothetical protein